MAIAATVRRWGSSLGIVLPSELVKEQALKEDDEILIDVVRQVDLHSFFGKLRRKR